MMVAMMMPSLVAMLRRYRHAVGMTGEKNRGWLTLLVGVGYFFVWILLGLAMFPVGTALAKVEIQLPALSRAVPSAIGAVALIAGVFQFTPWKLHHLSCCREASPRGSRFSSDPVAAWRHGLQLEIHCIYCCANLTAILLVIGVMDLRVMAAITGAITLERAAPGSDRVAKPLGAVLVGVGVFLIARTTQFG